MANNPGMYPQTRTRRGNGGTRDDIGFYVRSAWEANYCRYLKWLVSIGEIISWEYECDTFEFNGIKRGSRFYTPDFKITEKDGAIVYHEIKGYMDARSATKLRRMGKYHPDIKVILVDADAYHAIERKVKHIVENWESRR